MNKRLLTIVMVLLAATSSMNARKTLTSKQGYEIPANEISFSYGRISYPHCALVIGGVLGTAFTAGMASMDKCSSVGAFGLEYFRHVHPNVAVGGAVSYEAILLSFKDKNGDPQSSEWHHFVSAMPAVKFPWFSRPNVSMYSKLAVGVMMNCPDNNLILAFQLSPVGVDFGGSSSRGFVETGFGVNGLISAGYRYCF